MSNSNPALAYYLIRANDPHLGLSLAEAEHYSNAVVVQQLIGNLVQYSNFGTFEPRLAETWSNSDLLTWRFKLRPGLTCENGEAITPASFRQSLLRAIRHQETGGGALVFKRLRGFREFIDDGADLSGLEAKGDELIFHFTGPTKIGVLETLSYAPYGYICADNFSDPSTGQWKDSTKFISSGAYRLEAIELGREIRIKLRDDWALPVATGAAGSITFRYATPKPEELPPNVILDIASPRLPQFTSLLEEYPLDREYVSTLVLGNLEKGLFSILSNRQAFRRLLERYPVRDPLPEELWTKTSRMFPEQPDRGERGESEAIFTKQNAPILIHGTAPNPAQKPGIMVPALLRALEEAGLEYRFVGSTFSAAENSDGSLDLRLFSQMVGMRLKPWVIKVVFFSPIAYGYPDPSGNIRRLINDFDEGKVSYEDFAQSLFRQMEEDCTIIPFARAGVTLYLSQSIDRSSISPKMMVPRFDLIRIGT